MSGACERNKRRILFFSNYSKIEANPKKALKMMRWVSEKGEILKTHHMSDEGWNVCAFVFAWSFRSQKSFIFVLWWKRGCFEGSKSLFLRILIEVFSRINRNLMRNLFYFSNISGFLEFSRNFFCISSKSFSFIMHLFLYS